MSHCLIRIGLALFHLWTKPLPDANWPSALLQCQINLLCLHGLIVDTVDDGEEEMGVYEQNDIKIIAVRHLRRSSQHVTHRKVHH